MSSSTASYRTAATSPSNQQSQHLPPPPPLQRPGSLRRRTSSSRRTASHDSYADGVDQDDSGEADEPTTPLGPPVADPAEEELEEIIAARASGEHSLGGWHYAPLLVGVVPPLGSIFGGNANTWSDALLLCLASFWVSIARSTASLYLDGAALLMLFPTRHDPAALSMPQNSQRHLPSRKDEARSPGRPAC